MTNVVTIIIPVYNALADLKECLASLWLHTSLPVHVHIVNDASPDPLVRHYLDSLPANKSMSIIHREANLGFTGNINAAMAETEASNQDVIWLNTDTLVTANWLEGVLALASRVPKAATITPFSNNAEICSYPKFVTNNPVPATEQLPILSTSCAAIAAFDYPPIDMPTGVGFCMFVRRQAWREVGTLDVEAFGRGYGEENDWCQRALKLGWRHLFCPATFVVHKGGQSFSSDKVALVERNSKILNERHPGYDLSVQQFIAKDPIKPWRLLLTESMASALSEGTILHIVHGKEGGVLRHVADIKKQLPMFQHVVLKAMEEVWWCELDEQRYEFHRLPDQLWSEFLANICSCFRVRMIHLHHWVSCAEGLRLALTNTLIPYGLTLHDFYTACPLVHLIDTSGKYCGAPTEISTCVQCLAKHDDWKHVQIVEYRQKQSTLLQSAQFVLAPSQFTQQILRQYFPQNQIEMLPHSVEQSALSATHNESKTKRKRVAVVGAIGPVKGARELEQLASYLEAQQADWELHLIGYLDTHFHPGVLYGGYLQIHGAYQEGRLAHELHNHAVDLVLFPSLGPETYSYTLSEVWLAGYAAVCADVGTVAQRVRLADGGWVLSAAQSSTQIKTWVHELEGYLSDQNSINRKIKGLRGQASVLSEQSHMRAGLLSKYRKYKLEVAGSWDLTINERAKLRWHGLHAVTKPLSSTSGLNSALSNKLSLWLFKKALAWRHSAWGRRLESLVPVHIKHRLRTALLAR